MQEPPWVPRTEEEYRQQVAEDELIQAAGYYARIGERTYWNWFQALDTDQRRIVTEYMESLPEE
jgi:hypothetical protein